MKIRYTRKLTKIYNSFMMNDVSSEVKKIIADRIDMGLDTNRSIGSYIRETKAHNRMYKLHLFRSHTQNTDLEEDIKWWKEIVYFIIGF